MKFTQGVGPSTLDQGKVVGEPIDRLDGLSKVTGKARYAYEYHEEVPNAAYGWVVTSGIAKGRIKGLDLSACERAPGVLLVYTYLNVPHTKPRIARPGRSNLISQLSGPLIEHHGQAVAFVVAETLEQARAAAHLIKISYEQEAGQFELDKALSGARKPHSEPGQPDNDPDSAVGDFDGAFAEAPITVSSTYTTPDQSPFPMEPHATIAHWQNGTLTIYTAHQMTHWVASDVAAMMDVPTDRVRVVSSYVGGGFGSKLRTHADAVLSAFAARELGRPVKAAIARTQMLNHTTHRAATIQRVRLGATRDGRLTAIGHETWTGNLPGREYHEGASRQTRLLYAAPNRMTKTRLATLDLPEPGAMRAPATASGLMALEVAMDELAEKLALDPVELRILNDCQFDPERGPSRPYSGRKLIECLREGAQAFGWERRQTKPAQILDGRWLIGMGVATSFHHHSVRNSRAELSLNRAGRLTIRTSMTDIGTGTYTVLAQIASEMLGVPMDHITVQLGDSLFPTGVGSIASIGASSAGASIFDGCQQLARELARRAEFDPGLVRFEDGRIFCGNESRELAELAGESGLRVTGTLEAADLHRKFAQGAFGAIFSEAAVNVDTGEARVRRMLGVFAAGRILNAKLARSQAIGAMVFGIGAALMEEAVVDPQFGYFVNHDMAEYLVPVHADITNVDAIHLDDADDLASPIKAKGIGELGTCGAAASVVNAIYNATGVRVRDYPITLDKLLVGLP